MRTYLFVLTATLAAVAAGLAAQQGRAGGSTDLRGTVGPGFTITLKTAAGRPVGALKAGTYTFSVRDLSGIHNFHLLGPGVNKKTSVTATGKATWQVRLVKGTYRFQCDPHLQFMHGRFVVS